jgi:hypothetical protein
MEEKIMKKNILKSAFLLAIIGGFSAGCAVEPVPSQSEENPTATYLELCTSLPDVQTKTSLGAEPDFKVLWSKGDQIAVNGIASEPLTEEAHGKAATTFKISGGLNYPLSIVYPAPAKGTVAAEGMQVVTFQATQNYTVGSFAEGAVPMYAYVAAANEQAKLQHLAGILCFAIKGEGKTLTSMTLKSDYYFEMMLPR